MQGIPSGLGAELHSWRHSAGFADLAAPWTELVARVNPARMTPHTVTIRRGGALVAAGMCHVIQDLAVGDYVGGVMEKMTNLGRRFGRTPFGYDIAYLEIPLSNRSGVMVAPGLGEAAEETVWRLMLEALVGLRCAALCVKVDAWDRVGPRILAECGLVYVPFIAQSVLTFTAEELTVNSWHAQLPGRHGQNVRRQQRIFHRDSGGVIERIEDPSALAPVLGQLGDRVLAHAKGRGGLPLPLECGQSFYEHFHAALGDRGWVYLARVRGDLVGFLSCLRTQDTLFAKFVGLDYAKTRETSAYFNLHYRAIEDAIALGLRHVDFGTMMYDEKRRLGCRLFPSSYYIDFRRLSLRPLAPLLRRRFRAESEAKQ